MSPARRASSSLSRQTRFLPFTAMAALFLLAACGGDPTDEGGDSTLPSSAPSSADVSGGATSDDVSSSGVGDATDPDVSSSGPTSEPGPPIGIVNDCGGAGPLDWDGAPASPGDGCGPFGEGTLACAAVEALRCLGQAPLNDCGTPGRLPVEIGSACGPCADIDPDASGTWICGEDGEPVCVGARDPNACGGCAALPGRPGGLCEDGTGRWVCASREGLECQGPTRNACGGEGTLRFAGQPAQPGEPCDAGCGGGILVCDDGGTATLECVPGALGEPVNACGGCGRLPGVPGETCGPCGGGTWTCDGTGGLRCSNPVLPDACGNCTDRTERPGEACGVDGLWICAGLNLACESAIRPEDRNACGGAAALDVPPASACGECGEGIVVCVTPNDVECLGGDTRNACGGCGPLRGVEGQLCGECGSGSLTCAADGEALACEGDLGEEARNPCGRCSPLPVDLGDSCGSCLEWTCGANGGVRCELNPAIEGCAFDTCDDLDCGALDRSCIESDGSADALCDTCLKGFRESRGLCVPITDAFDPCDELDLDGCEVTSTVVGPAGGTARFSFTTPGVGTLTLLFPAGLLAEDTTITVAALSEEDSGTLAPPGLALASPIFLLEPAGLVFEPPITAQVPFRTGTADPVLHWTRPGDRTTFEERSGVISGQTVTALVSHFSMAVVSDRAAGGEPTAPTDPEPTGPDPTEPVPGTTDPGATEPEPTDPGATDPEPGATDPDPTDPDPTEPGTTEPPLPSVETLPVTDIEETRAQFNGTLTEIPPGEEPTVGFCMTADSGADPRIGSPGVLCEPVQQLMAPSPFDRLQTDLMPGTEYTVAAYAQGANGVAYGESIVFRTVILPVLASSTAGAVTATSVRLRGNLLVLGEPPANRLGHCLVVGVDTPRDGQPGTFCQNAPGGTVSTGPFDVDVEDLLPGTTYSFAPFADTDAGRVYGETGSFQTQ